MTTVSYPTWVFNRDKTKIELINQSMDKLTESASGNNKTLVIILTVTLPTLACLVVLIGIVVCYRRRATTIWLKQSDNSDRLQAILINLSPSSIQPQYYQNKFCLSHSQFAQPKTQTIVYNRLISAPSTPSLSSCSKSSLQGQTNAAFDAYSLKNDQQPILETSSTTKEQPIDSIHTEFPSSLQLPVPSVSSIYVEAIASHHLSTSSLQTSTVSHQSGSTSSLSSSPTTTTVLLFSQRTEF